ncbi:hypothetical protein CsSME_00027206 [Camellia sinensis var. sinensis]
MASSTTNNSNIRLKPRLCDCGRTAAMYSSHKEDCNYFKFADEDDDDSSPQSVPMLDLGKL